MTKLDADVLELTAQRLEMALARIEDGQCAITDGLVSEMRKSMSEANQAVQDSLKLLASTGVKMPEAYPGRADVPLHLLSTETGKKLLAKLREATEIAGDLDRERGWILPNGEPCGWGERVESLVYQLAAEVEPPAGRD